MLLTRGWQQEFYFARCLDYLSLLMGKWEPCKNTSQLRVEARGPFSAIKLETLLQTFMECPPSSKTIGEYFKSLTSKSAATSVSFLINSWNNYLYNQLDLGPPRCSSFPQLVGNSSIPDGRQRWGFPKGKPHNVLLCPFFSKWREMIFVSNFHFAFGENTLLWVWLVNLDLASVHADVLFITGMTNLSSFVFVDGKMVPFSKIQAVQRYLKEQFEFSWRVKKLLYSIEMSCFLLAFQTWSPKAAMQEPLGGNLQNWKCSPWAFLLGAFPKYHFEMLPLRHSRADSVSGKTRYKSGRAHSYYFAFHPVTELSFYLGFLPWI